MRITPTRIVLAVGLAALGLAVTRPTRGTAPALFRDVAEESGLRFRHFTGSSGEYYFRTIKPVSYSNRTRHIHFAIKMKGREKWTTQCYVKGEPLNQRDGVLSGIKDAKARESVIVDFAPVKGSRAGELSAKFDIVLGFTPVV